ncbi:MAG: LysM peptidoglycan-binding domain-containing protein [Deltaproteobacteria bacterium]|nr:LysM peptidoglycan-binding domain-containing protein [Deltaproteobacteria bacterium]
MRACVLAFGALWVAAPASAADIIHLAGADENVESIARIYYGSAWKAVYIAARNGLGTSDKVAGKRLVIPASWLYKVKRGDSLAVLAQRHLGDGERYKAVMLFNDIKDVSQLAPGQELLMPFHLFHVVQTGENPSGISRRYYRTTRNANLLTEYNRVSACRTGQKIVVPIFDRATIEAKARKAAPPKPAPAAAAKSAAPPSKGQATTDARRHLNTAIARYQTGEFDEACLELEGLLEDLALEGADKVALIQHLGFCAIAHGDNAAASDYFRKWIEMDSKAGLNPITTSPKILAVFHEVAGEPAAPNGASDK